MRPVDRIALVLMAEVIREHLQAGEDQQSLDILPSDRMQNVMDYLLEGAEQDINEGIT